MLPPQLDGEVMTAKRKQMTNSAKESAKAKTNAKLIDCGEEQRQPKPRTKRKTTNLCCSTAVSSKEQRRRHAGARVALMAAAAYDIKEKHKTALIHKVLQIMTIPSPFDESVALLYLHNSLLYVYIHSRRHSKTKLCTNTFVRFRTRQDCPLPPSHTHPLPRFAFGACSIRRWCTLNTQALLEAGGRECRWV